MQDNCNCTRVFSLAVDLEHYNSLELHFACLRCFTPLHVAIINIIIIIILLIAPVVLLLPPPNFQPASPSFIPGKIALGYEAFR